VATLKPPRAAMIPVDLGREHAVFSVPEGALPFWIERLERAGVEGVKSDQLFGEQRLRSEPSHRMAAIPQHRSAPRKPAAVLMAQFSRPN
jgi:hypothetical protein